MSTTFVDIFDPFDNEWLKSNRGSSNMEKSVLEPEVKKGEIIFLPYACENAPSFSDIDRATALLKDAEISHKQREIWKMMPKKNKEGKLERDEKTGVILMVKVVTRNSKFVTVKAKDGLVSLLPNGKVEPMDYTDVKEVVQLLEGK
jgi:hypothetical protein